MALVDHLTDEHSLSTFWIGFVNTMVLCFKDSSLEYKNGKTKEIWRGGIQTPDALHPLSQTLCLDGQMI